MNGKTIEGQIFCLERGLHPDWRGGRTDDGAVGPKVAVWE
jgi:hypothetical protein